MNHQIKTLRKIMPIYEKHVGHKIEYNFRVGEPRKFGIVERMIIDESIPAIVVFLKSNPFPERIYFDQVWDCECLPDSNE